MLFCFHLYRISELYTLESLIIFNQTGNKLQVKSTKHSKKIRPEPRITQNIDGNFPFFTKCSVFCDERFLNMLYTYIELLPPSGVHLDIHTHLPKSEQPGIYIVHADDTGWYRDIPDRYNLCFNLSMADEGYVLLVLPDKIIMIARTALGILYCMQSLRFLINHTDDKKNIPCVAIADWPRFPIRGISDDISRGQVSTLKHFRRILDFLARYKMNTYMPYLEDMYQFKSLPAIGQNRGALSAQECLEIQDYAESLGIQVVPVFQTLGHFENILIQPEFMPYAEFPGSSSLNTVSEKTYELLETMLDEFLPVFRSVWFNMGADESWDIGHGASRAKAEQVGNARVHADHYRRVIELVKKHHKKIMMYGDIILDYPDILQYLPSEIMIVDWHYDVKPYFPSTSLFKDSGKPFIVSPGTQSWSRIFPDLAHARSNISGMIRDGELNGAQGVITSAWGDFGGGNLRELQYYPWAWGACLAWNPEGNDLDDFQEAFFRDFYGASIPEMGFIYHALGSCSDYYDLNHFYGHPFYPGPRDTERFLKRTAELNGIADKVRKTLDHLRPRITRNQEHVDILDLCAQMYDWTGDLYRLRLDLIRAQQGVPAEPHVLTAQLDQLVSKLTTIRTRYREIWLRYFKPDNLQRLLDLMGRVLVHLESKKVAVRQGNLKLDGRLETPFITSPDELAKPENAYIVLGKSITLDHIPGQAWLQVIADSHARVWLNNQFVGEAVACRTLSAVVEAERVKWWSVRDFLRPGENQIIVVVNHYKKAGIAAANIWLQGEGPDMLVTSGDDWRSMRLQKDPGDDPPELTGTWSPAVSAPNEWIICRPDFTNGLPSRIEFYRQYPV